MKLYYVEPFRIREGFNKAVYVMAENSKEALNLASSYFDDAQFPLFVDEMFNTESYVVCVESEPLSYETMRRKVFQKEEEYVL